MEEPVLIDSREDILSNLDTVENYINSSSNDEFNQISGYIRRGHNFVCYKISEEYHFAPSRFIGYKNNSLIKHEIFRYNQLVSGSITDARLSRLNLLGEPTYNDELDKLYLKYCQSLMINPSKIHRRYWLINDEMEDRERFYEEGSIQLRSHLKRERNSKLIKDAKANFKKINGGRLFCEVCGFDFYKTFGKLGADFIEAHHKTPVSNSDSKHVVCIDDLAMVCPNCHRMLHKGLNLLTIESLRSIIKKSK